MAREITVTIAPDGNTKIETSGFVGSDCLKETADLEKALGVKTSDTKTREYNQRATVSESVRQGR